MVDKVNLNPFTQKAFTAEEIAALDTNKDGIVSSSEVTAKWDWLSAQPKDEEEPTVSLLDGGNKVAGVGDSAASPEELQQYLLIVADSYLKEYVNQNTSLTQEQLSSVKSIITASTSDFTAQYINKTPQGPYTMSDIVVELVQKLDADIKTSQESVNKANALLSGYKDNEEDNLSYIMIYCAGALDDNEVSDTEWNQIKNKMVQYLMGMLLNGNNNKDFLADINPNYQKDENYKNALNLVKQIQKTTNPDEIQSLVAQVQECITKFVEVADKNTIIDGALDYTQAQMEEAVSAEVQKCVDKYIQALVDQGADAATVEQMKGVINNLADKFLAKMAEEGNHAEYGSDSLETQFFSFVTQELNNLQTAKTEIAISATEIDTAADTLIKTANMANQDGTISEFEREQMIIASRVLISSQLYSGMDNIILLEKLNPNYKNTAEFSTAQDLVSKITTETDADKIAEYQKQLDEVLTKLLEAHTDEELVRAAKSIAPVDLDGSIKNDALQDSGLYSDYMFNVSRTGRHGKQNEKSLDEIQQKAREDLERYAESVKKQLKEQLGDCYDEQLVQKWIDDAITDTLAQFTLNVSRRNGHGNYNTQNTEEAFVFLRRSGSHKGRYTYNVQALINAFNTFFNATSRNKNAARLDSSKATYDRENVLEASLGDDYWRNKSVKIKGKKSSDEKSYAQIVAEAEAQLQKVAEALRKSLLEEGVPVSSSVIDSIIEECIAETISDMKAAFQVAKPNGEVTGGGIAGAAGFWGASGGAAIGTIFASSAATATAATAAAAAEAAAAVSVNATMTAWATAAAANAGVTSSAMASATASYAATAAASSAAASSTAATASAVAAAVPIVGIALVGAALTFSVLSLTTNLFGCTYGQHTADAGFYFERKSHSRSGRFGFDNQTLTNVFLAKFDQKLAEAKTKK